MKKAKKNETQIIQVADTIYKQNWTKLNLWTTRCLNKKNNQWETHTEFHDERTLCDSLSKTLTIDSIQNEFLINELGIQLIESIEGLSCPYSEIYADSIVTFIYPGKTGFPKLGKKHYLVVDMRSIPRDSLNTSSECYNKNSFVGYRKISSRIFYVTIPYKLFLGS